MPTRQNLNVVFLVLSLWPALSWLATCVYDLLGYQLDSVATVFLLFFSIASTALGLMLLAANLYDLQKRKEPFELLSRLPLSLLLSSLVTLAIHALLVWNASVCKVGQCGGWN